MNVNIPPHPPPHRMWFQEQGRAYIYIYIYIYYGDESNLGIAKWDDLLHGPTPPFFAGSQVLTAVMATTLESNIWQQRILHSKTFFPLKPHENVVFKCFSYLFIFSSEFLLSKPQ